jgi:hypothetical protein
MKDLTINVKMSVKDLRKEMERLIKSRKRITVILYDGLTPEGYKYTGNPRMQTLFTNTYRNTDLEIIIIEK